MTCTGIRDVLHLLVPEAYVSDSPSTVARVAWPAAFVIVAAMGFVALRREAPQKADAVVTVKPSAVIIKGLADVGRLETTTLSLEKVVEVKEEQAKLFGLVNAEDNVLYIAAGEATIGVDLAKVKESDVSVDAKTGQIKMVLPAPEVFSTRFDEARSYVHTRRTDLLASRNEALESHARREATNAFTKAAQQPDVIARARLQAERQLRSLASSWNVGPIAFSWSDNPPAVPRTN